MRILLVEDHKMLREGMRLLCERLQRWDVVGEAEDCATAIQLAQSLQPDIVLLDLILADGSAMDCLPSLREVFAGGIVVLTGAEEPGVHHLARENGADDVVVKGNDPVELFATIERIAAQKATDASPDALAA